MAKVATFSIRPLESPRFLRGRSGTPIAFTPVVAAGRTLVYVLKNVEADPRFSVGLTSDVCARVADHNAGRCPHTARHRPWRLHVVIEFPDEQLALRFERYLKSGSGRAFAKRHFGL